MKDSLLYILNQNYVVLKVLYLSLYRALTYIHFPHIPFYEKTLKLLIVKMHLLTIINKCFKGFGHLVIFLLLHESY